MNAKYFLILLLSSLVVLHGCDKLDDEPYKANLADFLNNNKPALQTFTVQAGVASEIHGAKGCTINFNANSFYTLSGDSVNSGSVEIQLREVTTKKDMVLSQTPTISNNELIVSQGVYYIKALQNGFELRINKLNISRTWSPFYQFQFSKVFLGSIVNDNFSWFPPDPGDSAPLYYVHDSIFSGDTASYQMYLRSTYYVSQNYNWINCDYFYTDTTARVAVFFPTADTLTDYFFQSYLVFNDLNAVLRYGHYTNNTIEFYNIPIGLNATLVTYYIVGGKVFVASAPIVVSDALSTPITFTETTEQGLLDILGGL